MKRSSGFDLLFSGFEVNESAFGFLKTNVFKSVSWGFSITNDVFVVFGSDFGFDDTESAEVVSEIGRAHV